MSFIKKSVRKFFQNLTMEESLKYPVSLIEGSILYQNSHQNAYGNLISQYRVREGEDDFTMYQCTRCNKYFGSYTGQEYHKCYSTPVISVSREAKDTFLDFVCCCNISANAITGKYFERFILVTGAQFITPYKKKFTEMLKEYALRIQAQMLASLKGEVVSILIDGAKKCTQEFEGVILYSHDSLKFFSCVPVSNQKADTLSKLIALIVKVLANNSTRVVSVCSDNASNNIKSTNGGKNSAQDLAGFFFIRQSCGAHSVNLAIGDVFKSDLYEPLHKALCIVSKCTGGPRETIRWESMYKVTQFVSDNFDSIKLQINMPHSSIKKNDIEKVRESLIVIVKTIYPMSLKEVVEVLEQIQDLIKYLEEDKSSIVDIFTKIYSTLCTLYSFPKYNFTQMVIEKLEYRALTTIHMILPLLSFLLTKEGLNAFRNANSQMQNQIFNIAKVGIANYQKEKANFIGWTEDQTNATINMMNSQLLLYIQTANSSLISYDYWKLNEHSNNKEFAEFSKFCREILTIPASEASVERLMILP